MNRCLALASGLVLSAGCAVAQAPVAPTLPLASTNTVPVLQPGGASGGAWKDAPLSTLAVPVNTYNNTADAVCANAAGDGAIIQAAVATGKRVHIIAAAGGCDLDSSVSFTTPGQIVYGDGRTVTVLNVSTILTTGALVFNTGEPGPILEDFGISFTQPNVSVRTGLTNYTPAIYAVATPRFKLVRMRITAAMGGVLMTGNSGGAVFDDFEESAFSYGVWVDGSLDTVRFDKWHFWPFGVQSNQLTIWDAPNGEYPAVSCALQTTSGTAGPIALYSGRLDGLDISNGLFLVGQATCFFAGGTGVTTGVISNTDFDTYGGLQAFAGDIQVSSALFTLGDNLHQAIYAVGTSGIQCASCEFTQNNNLNNMAVIDVSGGNVILTNAFFNEGAAGTNLGDALFVRLENSGALTINGAQIFGTAATQTNPKICLNCGGSGGQFSVMGVTPISAITSGQLFNVGADGYNRLIGNGLNTGWSNSCPTSPTHAVYANNGSASAATCN